MPLAYDDIPGSWGTYSKDWPSIDFSSEEAHNEARRVIIETGVVPYGSYVSVGLQLRIETGELKAKLLALL